MLGLQQCDLRKTFTAHFQTFELGKYKEIKFYLGIVIADYLLSGSVGFIRLERLIRLIVCALSRRNNDLILS